MPFLFSAFYLGWIIYWSLISRKVPRWVHRFYHADHDQPAGNSSHQKSLLGRAIQAGLILLLYTAFYYLFRPFCVNSAWTWGLATVSFLALVKPVSDNFWQASAPDSVPNTLVGEQGDLVKEHHSTDWATREQIQNSIPHALNDGMPVGIHIGEGFHWYDKGHMLTVGSFSQGKDVTLIIPALLSDGLVAGGLSVVCLDPSGEYAAVVAPHLTQTGYNVHVINPLNIPEITKFGNSRFNPLDHIEPVSHDARELYNVLSMALYTRQKSDEDTFFDHRCRQYISLYLSFSNYLKESSFHSVSIWLTYPVEKRRNLLEFMVDCKSFEGADTAFAIIARLNSVEADLEEQIYKAIEEAITILKNEQIRASLAASDFAVQDVFQKPTAIFICVPFEDLPQYAPWIQMILSFLLRMLTKRHDQRRKVVVVLDEVLQLDCIDEIIYSWTVLIDCNVTLWLVVYHYGQLKMTYGAVYEMFIFGAMIKHWFSVGEDTITANYLTSRMPQALTIIGPDCDDSPEGTDSAGLDIGFTQMICEISGLELPIKFDKVPYWELPFSRDNAPPNPFH